MFQRFLPQAGVAVNGGGGHGEGEGCFVMPLHLEALCSTPQAGGAVDGGGVHGGQGEGEASHQPCRLLGH